MLLFFLAFLFDQCHFDKCVDKKDFEKHQTFVVSPSQSEVGIAEAIFIFIASFYLPGVSWAFKLRSITSDFILLKSLLLKVQIEILISVLITDKLKIKKKNR